MSFEFRMLVTGNKEKAMNSVIMPNVWLSKEHILERLSVYAEEVL